MPETEGSTVLDVCVTKGISVSNKPSFWTWNGVN